MVAVVDPSPPSIVVLAIALGVVLRPRGSGEVATLVGSASSPVGCFAEVVWSRIVKTLIGFRAVDYGLHGEYGRRSIESWMWVDMIS